MSRQELRLDFVDAGWAQTLLAYYQNEAEALVRPGGQGLTQTDWAMLAGCREMQGCLDYALGAALGTVKAMLGEAARAWLEVFLRRGTEPALEYTEVELSAEPDAPVRSRIVRGEGDIDDSLTNSRSGLRAMHVALAAGEDTLARQIGRLVGDPPGARYLSPTSVIATPDDQRVAYAFRALLSDNPRECLRETLPALDSPAEDIRLQATAMRALATGNAGVFLDYLRALLVWNRNAAVENPRDPAYFICFPALALARLALRAKLVPLEDMPVVVFLPLGLPDSDHEGGGRR
jgi:hypothetical protein